MFSRVKTRERELARNLRREEGAAINEIARRIGVSKSSVSLWVRDIDLSEEQRQALLDRNRRTTAKYSGWTKLAERRRAERLSYPRGWPTACAQSRARVRRRLHALLGGAALALPPKSLRKSVVNVYSKYSKRKRVGNLPFGTCRVVVSRTWVVQTIFGAIQELGGFTREAWLE